MGHRAFSAPGPLTALAVNPTNEFAVVGGREVLRVLSVGDGDEDAIRETLNLHVPEGNKLSGFAPTDVKWSSPSAGNLVATASTAGVAIYDLGRPSAQKLDRVISEHTRAVNRVHFHPTDSFLLLSGSQDGTIKMWDLRTRNVARATIDPKSEGVRDVQFNPLGTWELAAAFENGSVQTWDLRRAANFDRRYNAHNGLALALDWHSNGRYLATGGRDKMIKVWDTSHEIRKPVNYIQTIASVARVAWKPGNSFEIASCSLSSDFRVYVWHIERPFIPDLCLERHDNVVTGMVWGPRDMLYTCSRDHTMVAHSTQRDGYRIHDMVSDAAMAISIADLALVASDKKHVATPRSEADRLSTDKSSRSVVHGPSTAIGRVPVHSSSIGTVAMDRVSNRTFSFLARHYVCTDDPVSKACQVNAKIAEYAGLHQTAQVWLLLHTLVAQGDPLDSMSYDANGARKVIDDCLKFYADQGNVQMCCTMLMVLPGALTLPEASRAAQSWFMAYIGQLLQSGLHTIAASIVGHSKLSSVAELNTTNTTIYNSCTCGKPGTVLNGTIWRCEDQDCRTLPVGCSFCHRPVKGLISWCQGCLHGES
ncbi:WD40-repeat-containing domain protein [Hyaloraphidium curvatum]|nr:WD40-repeat-containing domain protein [Hyaloraphidium curvatum]